MVLWVLIWYQNPQTAYLPSIRRSIEFMLCEELLLKNTKDAIELIHPKKFRVLSEWTTPSAVEDSTTVASRVATEIIRVSYDQIKYCTPHCDVIELQAEHSLVAGAPRFHLDLNDCSPSTILQIKASEGSVYGFNNSDSYNGSLSTLMCLLDIVVPRGYLAQATVDLLSCSYTRDISIAGAHALDELWSFGTLWNCPYFAFGDMRYYKPFIPKMSVLISKNEHIFFKVSYFLTTELSDFLVHFKTADANSRDMMHATPVPNSTSYAYVTFPGFSEDVLYPAYINATCEVLVPADHSIVVSFPFFDLRDAQPNLDLFGRLYTACIDYLELYTFSSEVSNRTFQWRKCGVHSMDTSTYNQSIFFRFVSEGASGHSKGFKLLYSFYRISMSPVRSANGLWDCSRHYDTFRQHLDCNLRQECQGGEDEHQGCPYYTHNSQKCPPGAANEQDKCVSYHAFEARRKYTTWQGARLECQRLGGDLAMPKTPEQLDRIHYIMGIKPKGRCAYVGLRTVPISHSTDSMYRKTLRWVDETTCYYCNMSTYSEDTFVLQDAEVFRAQAKTSLYETTCYAVLLNEQGMYYPVKCSESLCSTFLCDRQYEHSDGESLKHPEFKPTALAHRVQTHSPRPSPFVVCPHGHVIHTFLSCDPQSQCGVKHYVTQCELYVTDNGTVTIPALSAGKLVSVEMFECYTMGETIPYTLVCDFRRDCQDGSDELHCQHEGRVPGFRCASGQGISVQVVCDVKADCLDGSDEEDCVKHAGVVNEGYHRKPAPVIIHMDGRGDFTEEPMDPADPTCPETHFTCPGQHVYCMPVYLRCNGVKDCPGGEDEVSCDDVTCPGYYRCRSSSVCLHGDHLCDGWPQCPERDDELLCNVTCPSACHCQGLAFVCQQPFVASRYPDLRYLDAAGSGMVPEDVADNFYLVYLSLARSGLKAWPQVVFHNLQRLDLSYNLIETFNFLSILPLRKLRALSLKGNPLYLLKTGNHSLHHSPLTSIDLSHTNIQHFHSGNVSHFKDITNLNLSFSRIERIMDRGFSDLPNLLTIDLRGNGVDTFPGSIFSGLDKLERVFADNYRVCCKSVLPPTFNTENCISPQAVLSSCENLLRFDYRLYVWVVGVVSLVSNVSSVFVIHRLKQNTRRSGQSQLLTNLNVANCLTGVYLITVGVADTVYRGDYLSHESVWKANHACKMAGVLFVLSIEVSFLVMILISLDQVLVLSFPSSTVSLQGRSAVSASALAWTVGLLLAAVPLLPSLSHWSFYSQTGICVPLVLHANHVQGNNDFLLGLLISTISLVVMSFVAFEIVLSRARSRGSTYVEMTLQTIYHDLIVARRFHLVVTFNVLVWACVFVLGLMVLSDIPFSEEVGVAINVVLLSLGPAVNPLLYVFRERTDRRRIHRQQRIVKTLQGQKTLCSVMTSSHSGSCT